MTKTDRQIRIEEALGRDIVSYVDERSAAGRSWVKIAFDVMTSTGIEVTHETLRTWYRTAVAEAEASR